MDALLVLGNHHRHPAPAIERQPGRYLGCFENRYGEQLVFVHDAGQATASVYAGDVDWQRHRVSDAGGRPVIEGLVLNDEELAFVSACWLATAPSRPAPRRRGDHG
jgi:hypothetical protein